MSDTEITTLQGYYIGRAKRLDKLADRAEFRKKTNLALRQRETSNVYHLTVQALEDLKTLKARAKGK